MDGCFDVYLFVRQWTLNHNGKIITEMHKRQIIIGPMSMGYSTSFQALDLAGKSWSRVVQCPAHLMSDHFAIG